MSKRKPRPFLLTVDERQYLIHAIDETLCGLYNFASLEVKRENRNAYDAALVCIGDYKALRKCILGRIKDV